MALGIQLTSAGRAASVAPTLMPVFAGLIGWAIFRLPPTSRRFTGYAAIVVGFKRLFQTINMRPAAARVCQVGKDHPFKKTSDEESRRALFPSN